jgi:hypothetical protein
MRVLTVEVSAVRSLKKWSLFLAVPLVLMLAVSAAASTPPSGKVKWTNAGIESVAMDGSRVAYSTELNGVYSWDVRSGRSVRLARPSSSTWPLVHELAIAGQRVAWIARDVAGNSQETNEDLYTASVTWAGLKKLGHAYHALDFIEPQPTQGVWLWRGDWITGLVGSGKVLAVSRWTTTPDQQGETTISNPRLSLISPSGRLRPIASGEPSIVSRSVDGGRVAVLRPQDRVGIYSAAGTLLRELNPPTAREIALSGDNLVVLTETSTLSVYNWRSGRLVHRWRVPSARNGVFLEDVSANTAVYSVYSHGRNLHLLQLSTGKDLLLVKGPGLADRGGRGAQLEAPGLVYAVDKVGAGGKLVFVPMARVLAAVSKGHVR